MGEVFKARDTRLDRVVALKTSRAQFTDRFQREARAIAALNHPHIATLYDVGPEYLVMEFVEGEVLRGPLPLARALLYARQILEALEAAHAKGIVHRDLKPANVMLAKSGVKLLDFGLAQMKAQAPNLSTGEQTATMAMTAEGTIAGTLQYMSPEQLQGKEVDARSDLFAFGAVLYEMLTGLRAFTGDNAASVISAVMTSEPRPVCELKPAVPAGVERVIALCLKKDPDERWQSARDIRHALDLVERAGPLVAASPGAARKLRWWVAAAFVAGAALAALGIRSMTPKPSEPPAFRPLTYSGRAERPSLSPDG
jgi:serine/threonine protein kinase